MGTSLIQNRETDPETTSPAARETASRTSGSARDTGDSDRSRTRGGVRGVKRSDVILLANQLAVMLDTGVPLSQALNGIAGRSVDPRFETLLTQVIDDVEAGEPFSRALSKHPRVFPTIMVALLRASEASGTLSAMLNRLAGYLTKEHLIVKQVRGALMYPAFMFLVCICITVFLLTFIMPRFASIYAGRDAALPALTQGLMDVSQGLVTYWPYWTIAAFAAGAACVFWPRTNTGRRQLDWLKLNVPVFSTLFGKLYLSRSCRTLGTMIETGVPLLEAVELVRAVTNNVYYEQLWDRVDENLRHGQPFSEALFDSPVFPDHVAQMIESGERAGRLGDVFNRVADFCEIEFDEAVKTATKFIEPVMMVGMGGIIGVIAIALLVPIFKVASVASG